MLTPALRRSLEHLEESEQWTLLEDLRAGGGNVFLYRTVSVVRAVSTWPLPPALRGELREESGPDVLPLLEHAGQSLVLERRARDQASAAVQPLTRRGRNLERLLDKLREEETRLEGMCAAQADALALRENLWRWPPELRAPGLG